MNDSGNNAKQQIVEKIKDNSNILVTVNTNPTVDELTAALGLTMMLNKIGKHTTAVVSGELPRAIDFLEPGKTFENTVDSLRDFIIALDKEKADHLRYKVDGDVVKIFITPYRTTISDKDLDFSQGDYNVEFVVAIGVNSRDDLDKALSSHGRILHDATVSSLTLGDEPSDLGSIDWLDSSASSYSEMLVSLSEALKSDKSILDEQIATALLTGIVSATDRFSNERTSSKVMTMSAQLMGAGANQQLIASKLSEAREIGPNKNSDDNDSSDESDDNKDGTTELSEGQASKIDRSAKNKKKKSQKPKKKDDGALVISHEKEGDVDEVRQQTEAENQQSATDVANESLEKAREEATTQDSNDAAKQAEDELEEQLKSVTPEPAAPAPAPSSDISVSDLQKDLADASAEVDQAAEEKPDTAGAELPQVAPEMINQPQPEDQVTSESVQPSWQDNEKPSIGGTLNATTEQAAEDSRREATQDVNRTILKHDSGSYVGDGQPTFDAPLNATNDKASQEPAAEMFSPTSGDNGATGRGQTIEPQPQPQAPAPAPAPPQQTLADLDSAHRAPAAMSPDNERDAVSAAYDSAPFNPAGNPQASLGAQPLGDSVQADNSQPVPPPMPPMPDFSTLPPPPPVPEFDPGAQPSGALPPDQLGTIFGSPDPNAQPLPAQPAPQSNDPGQFQIPGQ
ncbi:MAG: hypothetical protein L0H36_01135 [bacterium]|nr:hypothetical protein [bacterium]